MKCYCQPRMTVPAPDRVFVPSVIDSESGTIGLGIFSSEETAWNVLRAFIKKSQVMHLTEASVVVWDVDIIGENAMNVLSQTHCRQCPVCKRQTFWMDLDAYSGLCYGDACEAWLEESSAGDDLINCGWPPTRFMKQTKSIEDALKELAAIGAQIEAAGNTPKETERDLLYGATFSKADQ
jgi:hypothetical protein